MAKTGGEDTVPSMTVSANNTVAKGQTGTPAPIAGGGGMVMSTADDEKAKEGKCKKKGGDPVSILTGDVVITSTDLNLPGILPLDITRNYSTELRKFPSGLGIGWALNLEQYIEPDEDGLRLREPSGLFLYFAAPDKGSSTFIRSKGYQVFCLGPGSYRVLHTASGVTREFSATPGASLSRLRRIVDARGNHVNFYYQNERLAEVVDTAKRRIVFSPDEQGRITRVEVWVQNQSLAHVQYAYHPDGELSYAEDALGHRERFEYDAHHRMVKRTWKNGVAFNYQYDLETGDCTRTWGPGGLHENKFLRERKDDHILVTVTGTEEPLLNKFNLNGDLIEERSFDDQWVKKSTCDEDHYVLSESNASGETTTYEYDEFGQRTKIIDAAGNSATTEYEQYRPKRRITADQLEILYFHNDYGELTGVRFPTSAEYHFDRDEYGRIAMVYGPDGLIARFGYDEFHNLIEEQDAKGALWRYTYDSLGRPLTRTDPLGAVTRLEYDTLGQVVRASFPDGTITESAYDPLGKVKEFTDPQGRVTRMQYAGTGSLVEQELPDGSIWKFEYDTSERLREIINPKFERYRFYYDRLGRVEKEITFDNRELKYSYDTSGRPLQITQPDQSYRRFVYDAVGNLLEEHSPHGAQHFERDAFGRLVAATIFDGPEAIRVEFERDRFGRIVKERQGEREIAHTLDVQGRRTQRQVPFCGTTEYDYDPTGVLDRLFHEAPSGAKQELHLDRDLLGREIARRSQDGQIHIEQAFDSMDRLVEQKIQAPRRPGEAAQKLLSQRQWQYDLSGRVTQIGDSRWGTTSYEYDRLGQLTSAKRGKLHEVFEYQANGSLVRALNALAPETAVEGESRWDIGGGNLLRSTDRHTYEYDRCHRRIAKIDRETQERTTYVWDCRDRLREVQLPDGRKARYFYDAFGRRVRKEITPDPSKFFEKWEQFGASAQSTGEPVPAASLTEESAFGTSLTDALQQLAELGAEIAPRITEFLWDGDEIAAELDTETGPRGHVHYPGTFVPLLQIERGEIFVVVTDHLGTPRDLLGGDGTIRWSAAYTAWGKIHEEYSATNTTRGPPTSASEIEEGDAVRSPFRLLGQYFDEETGLSATRFRMWEAETGRWLSPDPLGIVGGDNLLGVSYSPTRGADPLGLVAEYQPTDSLGRATGAFADITPADLGGSTNPSYDPVGFQGGEHPYHHQRGHLIAASLGGSNSDPRNFVTITDGTNHPGMSIHENRIRDYLNANPNGRVLLQVTPLYRGNALVPYAVRMYAVDDKGRVIVDVEVANGLRQAHKSGCC